MEALARIAPAAGVTLAAVAMVLVGEARDHAGLRRVFKPLASAGFLAAALRAGAAAHPYGQALLVALALSWWGDVFLLSDARRWFLAGLAAFLLAHVGFGVAFVVRGVDPRIAGVAVLPLATVAVVLFRGLFPGVPAKLRGPVVGYAVVVTAMVALAFGAWGAGASPLLPGAALAFWMSDYSVARDRFAGAGFANRAWGLPLYYVAQLAFAMTAADLTAR
jgi:uncharacterized membrane protein YhhN